MMKRRMALTTENFGQPNENILLETAAFRNQRVFLERQQKTTEERLSVWSFLNVCNAHKD